MASKRKGRKSQKEARARDYKAEYERRVAKGRASGKTRQQARGHARGEGKQVRARPATPAARSDAKARGKNLSAYNDALKLAGAGREKHHRYQGSLYHSHAWGRTLDVYFVFKGVKINTSPPNVDVGQVGRVTIPRYFTEEGGPNLGTVLADLGVYAEEARAEAAIYLEDPQLERVWYNKGKSGVR